MLAGHDRQWPLVFQAEQRRLGAVLGHRAVAIEHVGSSSVPGLGGRREVDVLVGVRSVSDIDGSARLLTGLGYLTTSRLLSPSEGWCLLSRPGSIPFELLIVKHNGPLWSRHIGLRNYLRQDPNRARAYGQLKSRWARRYGPDTEAYKEAKRQFWASVP